MAVLCFGRTLTWCHAAGSAACTGWSVWCWPDACGVPHPAWGGGKWRCVGACCHGRCFGRPAALVGPAVPRASVFGLPPLGTM
eukprot:3520869-Alexandrium_andersonii.AAC.1